MATFTKQEKEVPELRFNGFSEPWRLVTLQELTPSGLKYGIVDGPFGSNLKTIHYKNSGIPIITSGYVTDGKFHADKYLYVTKEKFEQEKRSSVKGGDIVMAKIGARCGASAIMPPDHEIGILSGNALKITVDNSRYSTYLIWTLLWNDYKNNKLERIKTVGAQPAVSIANLKKYEFVVPEIQEQQKVADFLGSVDAWLDNLLQQKTALETYKRGMMQRLFTRQVRFKDDSGKDFPEWQEMKLGQLEDSKAIKLGRGNVISKQDIASKPGDHPIYSSSVKENGLFGSYAEHMFDEELITWSVDGGGHFFYRPKHKFSVTNVSGWMRILSKDIVTKFLAYQLQFHHAKVVFDYSSKAHPSVIRGVYTVALPAFEEQQKIADFLTAIDQTITAKAEEISKAEQWKKGLMQKMFV